MTEEAGDTRTRGEAAVEIVATVLLALATVATAWSGYQASRWSGEQTKAYSRANAARLESTRASALANTQTQIDVAVFTQWVNAYANDETELADFYFKRFREEFRPALNAWLATKPRTNPDAPLSPFAMPQYQLAARDDAARLELKASADSDEASRDNQRSDNYVLGVVLFATALFFAGVSTRLPTTRSQAAILTVGCVIFLGAVIWIATFPISISV